MCVCVCVYIYKYMCTYIFNLPTKVAQNDSEQPILPYLEIFQSFLTEVVQNDLEWPISPDLLLFPPK